MSSPVEKVVRDNGIVQQPFEYAIVDVIHGCVHLQQFFTVAALIKITEIKKNHTNIITAWERRIHEVGVDDDFGVPESIRAQHRSRKGSR